MSKKRIENLIGYDFHTPNNKNIMKFLADNYETDRCSNALWDESDRYLTPSNSGMYTSNTQWGSFIPMEDFKSIIDMPDSQPTYTQSELSYIESLEDEVAKLEELCSDYVSEIEQLRGITIQPEANEFKPISEMTIEDWHQAMDDRAVFEDEDGYTLTLEQVDPDGTLYFLECVYVCTPKGECAVGDSVVSKRIK